VPVKLKKMSLQSGWQSSGRPLRHALRKRSFAKKQSNQKVFVLGSGLLKFGVIDHCAFDRGRTISAR
jgi:hypothetical protein